MFFWPDIRFRPKVKNIPSVIHCLTSRILEQSPQGLISSSLIKFRWDFKKTLAPLWTADSPFKCNRVNTVLLLDKLKWNMINWQNTSLQIVIERNLSRHIIKKNKAFYYWELFITIRFKHDTFPLSNFLSARKKDILIDLV